MSEIAVQADPAGTGDAASPGPLPKRLVDAFVAPAPLFRRFGPRAPWVDAMIVSTLLLVIAMVVIPGDVWLQTARDQIATDPRMAGGGMSAEQLAGVSRGIGIGSMVVFPWIMLLVQGGILLAIFTMLGGGEATYRQYLAVGAHAAIIGAVGQLLTLPVIIGRGNVQATISLAALVPGMEPGFLTAFLGVFNVFLLWQLVVLGIGVAVVNRRDSATGPIVILLAILTAIALVVGLVAGR